MSYIQANSYDNSLQHVSPSLNFSCKYELNSGALVKDTLIYIKNPIQRIFFCRGAGKYYAIF